MASLASGFTYFLEETGKAIVAAQTELAVFALAICAHYILFGKRRLVFPGKKRACSGAEVQKSNHGTKADTTWSDVKAAGAHSGRGAKQSTLDRSEILTLKHDLEALLCSGADCETLASKLRGQLKLCDPDRTVDALVAVVQGGGKVVDAQLLAAVRIVADEAGLKSNLQLGEALMKCYLNANLISEFDATLAEIEHHSSVALPPGVGLLALRAALQVGNLHAAMARFRSLGSFWGETRTASTAPQGLLRQLATQAGAQHALPGLVRDLQKTGLNEGMFEVLLIEIVRCCDYSTLRAAEDLGRAQCVTFSGTAYAALIRGATTSTDALRLFEEAVERDVELREPLVAAVRAAGADRSNALMDAVLRRLPPRPPPEVAEALLRFLAGRPRDGADPDAAIIELFETRLAGTDLSSNVCAERFVVDAALRRDRQDILERLVATAPDVTRRVMLIKSLGTDRRLLDAFKIFNACKNRSVGLFNALLDATIECRDLQAAERLMADAKEAGLADTVTYNTMVKAHLQLGNTRGARTVVAAMRSVGVQPNVVTFNELLDAAIRSRGEDTWNIVDEMKACGAQPNSVTSSILLKTVQSNCKVADLDRVMKFIDEVECEMDEVLLSSVVEACVRAGRADLLEPHLRRQRTAKRVHVSGAHTYGSLIRANGFVGDTINAWGTWREMRTRNIVPTCVTLGCMVEALVINGDVEGGHKLIGEMLNDEECRSLVNAVIYCSVLKGFSQKMRVDRVWAVYNEMLENKIVFSIVTYNTLVDACARVGDMARIPSLLEDMAAQGIQANIITYSAILKGYCKTNRIDKAIELVQTMRSSTNYRPDEVMFNTLLDGCARQGRCEQGKLFLEEMVESGVKPSNFTLSVLVKLAGRGKRLDWAHELVEDIAEKYHFRPNIHVLSNLVNACIVCKDLRRAFEALERMIRDKVRPDVRTYTLLLNACTAMGQGQDAAGLLRSGVGLRGGHPRLDGACAGLVQPQGGLPSTLITEVLEGIAGPCHDERLAVQLFNDLKRHPGVKLDQQMQMRLTSRAIRTASWD